MQTTARGRAIADGLAAEQEADRLTARKSLADERADVQRRIAVAQREHDERHRSARAIVEEKHHALVGAQHELARLQAEHADHIFPLQQRAERIENALRDSASPLIAAFIQELRDELMASLRSRDHVLRKDHEGRLSIVEWDNYTSVATRVQRIREAIEHATNTLHLEPVTDDDLRAQFEQMRASLPAIEDRPAKYAYEGNDAA